MVTAKSSSVVQACPRDGGGTSAVPQEVATDKLRAAAAASLAIPPLPAWHVTARWFDNDSRRVLGQQIIQSARW
jgi:hypothetical protein